MPPTPDLPDRLHQALTALGDLPALRRLRIRLDEAGENSLNEVRQFRLLQKACREDGAVQEALDVVGWSAVAGRPTVGGTAETGAMIQAFNTMIERHWEE